MVRDDELFWTNWGTVLRRCSVANGAKCVARTMVSAGETDGPMDLAVTGNALYWNTVGLGSAVRTCELPACQSIKTLPFASGGSAIAIDESGVYVGRAGGESVVETCALAGCVTPRLFANDLVSDRRRIVLDEQNVFVVTLREPTYRSRFSLAIRRDSMIVKRPK